MKKLIYTGIALIGAVLSNLGFAQEQVQSRDNLNLKEELPSEITLNKKVKPFVYSDVVKKDNNIMLCWHSSHASHASHFSHRSSY